MHTCGSKVFKLYDQTYISINRVSSRKKKFWGEAGHGGWACIA